MNTITYINEIPVDKNLVYLVDEKTNIDELSFTKTEMAYVKKQIGEEQELIAVNSYFKWTYVVQLPKEANAHVLAEKLRKTGSKLSTMFSENKFTEVVFVNKTNSEKLYFLLEGAALAAYTFDKYKTADKKMQIAQQIVCDKSEPQWLSELNHLLRAVYITRDLVNEPLSGLNAPEFSKRIQEYAKSTALKVEVFDKKKIEALGMGGLLAVNRGSIDPPTFNIMEWKPDNAKNNQPFVVVGKGVMFDTGGLSLKPTKGSMDLMKSDMAGGAAVVGAMLAVAQNKLPLHVIGLVPATDNRPGGNAYVPQDVVKMMNGKTVEVLNTDAEGRMILADALTFADKYNPALIVELSTLTGSAEAAIGPFATVAMGNENGNYFGVLKQSGEQVHERLVEFPFWEDYGELIKSDVADIKNVGGRFAGAITAGKFLEHFTKSPFIHLDIAGPSFFEAKSDYRTVGGTGVGVRMLYQFFKSLCQE